MDRWFKSKVHPKAMTITIHKGDITKLEVDAAAIAIKTVNSYKGDLPEEVIFACFDDENYDIYQHQLT